MDKNLPITRDLLTNEIRRIQALLLDAKYGRRTDLAPLEIDLMIGNCQQMIHELRYKASEAPRVFGFMM